MPKSIFVGLGGVGVQTVGHLKARLLEQYSSRSQLMDECRFVVIDTDKDAIDRLENEYAPGLGPGGRLFLPEEYVDLGGVNPYSVFTHARRNRDNHRTTPQDDRLLTWVDETLAESSFENQSLRHGAGAIRQAGRLALAACEMPITTALRTSLEALTRQQASGQPAEVPAFHIVSGTCGGTGSASFIDLCYLIYKFYGATYQGTAPTIRAFLFMPTPFLAIHEKSFENKRLCGANGFAFFSELSTLVAESQRQGGHKYAALAAIDPEGAAVQRFEVLNFAACIDSITEGDRSIDLQSLYRTTAKLLAIWHAGGAIQGAALSSIDNVPKGSPPYVQVGFRELTFPSELLDQYLKVRFRYELILQGLLGPERDDAMSREDFGALAGRLYHDHIARRLFSEYAEPQQDKVPNLEVARNAETESALQSVTLARFMKEGKDTIDLDKITSINLKSLEDTTESALAFLLQRFGEEFDEGDTSKREIIERVKSGSGTGTGLVDDIEDAIVRIGAVFARSLAQELDLRCDLSLRGEKKSIQDEVAVLTNDLLRASADRQSAKASALDSKKKRREREKALRDFHTALVDECRVKAKMKVAEQQTEILDALSRNGLLDLYVGRLEALTQEARQALRRQGVNGLEGLEIDYTMTLLKRFKDTAREVTVLYVPEIHEFTDGTEWRKSHLFDTLYRGQIVESETVADGTRVPKRRNGRYGAPIDITRLSLESALWRVVTNPTGSEPTDWDGGRVTTLFRLQFADEKIDSNQVIRILLQHADALVASVSGTGAIHAERTKTLHDRFKSLKTSTQKSLQNEFSDEGTKALCRFSGGTGPTVLVYSGADEALAKELGYDPKRANEQQFVRTTRNSLVRFKVVSARRITDYAGYETLRSFYEQRPDKPHLHRLFNRFGPERGLREVDLTSFPEERFRAFVLGLLYWYVFRAVETEAAADPSMEKEKLEWMASHVIHRDARFIGDEFPRVSPLLIEKLKDDVRILVCDKMDRTDDGLFRLRQGSYRVVTSRFQNLRLLYGEFERNPSGLANVVELHDAVLGKWDKQCEKEVDRALQALQAVATKAKTDALRRFSAEVVNEATKAVSEMKAAMGKNPSLPRFQGDEGSGTVETQELWV